MSNVVDVKHISPKYEKLADLLILRPDLKNPDLAAELGVSETWLSSVKNSNTFKEYFRERRTALESEIVKAKMGEMTGQALVAHNQILAELQRRAQKSTTSTKDLLGITDRLQKVLGLDRQDSPMLVIAPQQQVGVVDADLLRAARERMGAGNDTGRAPVLVDSPTAAEGEAGSGPGV